MTPELTLLSRVACRGREITAPRLRGLLALLAREPGAGCGTGRIVEGLWPEEKPEHPAKAVQILVSRLRAQLGAEIVVSTPTGYRLGLAPDRVDSSALLLHEAAGAERARTGDHAGALAQAEAGLALWDGDGADAADDGPLGALRADRAHTRRALARTRALALARLGRRQEAAAPLAEAVADAPRDEEALAELLRCEPAPAALARYAAYRHALREALGTDPGPALRAVHEELLHADAPRVRHGVPHEPNPLLGRDGDIAAVAGLLRTARVVTVTGTGGLGKTRLAHAVSHAAEQPVVHFVPLAGVQRGDDVTAEVATAVGTGFPGTGDPADGILNALGPRPALLVLDNCEHVVTGVAALVRTLVARSAGLRILATSRAPLGLTSESVYELPELPPDAAAELFTQRARAARPGVELPPETVAEICAHLDGLPLAVELAAARVRVLSVTDVSRRLRDRFALLRGGARDAPERHRTLRAVVDWSWHLLEPDGRTALRALSVFPGGFDADAAERVLDDAGDTLALLEQLAGQSLLKVVDGPLGTRFRMLETLREFGAARRAEAGEEAAVTDRFLLWARDFGRAHHDVLFGAAPVPAWDLIRAEQDNLVLALRHALARADHATTAATAAVLGSLWATESHYARLAALIEETGRPLSHFRPTDPRDVEALRSASVVATGTLFMAHGPHAVRQLATLRRLPPAPPDTVPRALAVVLAAMPEIRPPAYERLTELCEADEPMLAGTASTVASYVWDAAQDIPRALHHARRMLTTATPFANPALRMLAHGRISELCLRTERGEEAYEHLRIAHDSLGEYGSHNDWTDPVGVRWALVLACLQLGRVDEAEYWYGLAALDRTPETVEAFTSDLGARAEITLARGRVDAGLRLWRASAEQVRETDPDDPFMRRWSLEVRAATVAAHALHGRAEQVAGLAGELRELLPGLSPGATHGAVLLAVALAGLAEGDAGAVRLVALSEVMPVARDFPVLSAGRARGMAEEVDAEGYARARAEFEGLGREEVGERVRALLAEGAGAVPGQCRGSRTNRAFDQT
ncbi:winged helix-turn-helix domain-containing protein [Streptomyces roseirectus]|uniref:Winged helix-turn-helix domain-containing protein n=1 Tax=Streptomyces roseirectus TaxID=2768066 RepID=A0A7H0INC4_9ACTN|nr:BTAD domain-containing putative transcriptional regulator [Streptomyces roseirectus]QNP74290.1 winged helix-turn-helix domain-containing protein [Streptomyces roseirectus]